MQAIRDLFNMAQQQQPQPDVDPFLNDPEVVEARRQAIIARALRDAVVADEERQQLEMLAGQRRRLHTQQAFHEIRTHMFGKKIDAGTKQFVAAKVLDYLDEVRELDREVRNTIVEEVWTLYLAHLENEPALTIRTILAARQHNRNLEGRIDERVWYNPFTWHKAISVSENGNGSSGEHNLYSISQAMTIGLLGAGAIMAGTYCISKLCTRLTSIITTPKVTPPHTPPIQIDIPQLSCLNPSLTKLVDSINISNSLDVTPASSLDNSTSTELLITVSGRCIKTLSTNLKLAAESLVELCRSLR